MLWKYQAGDMVEVQVDNTWGMLALENYRKIIVGGVSRRGPPASRVSLGTLVIEGPNN